MVSVQVEKQLPFQLELEVAPGRVERLVDYDIVTSFAHLNPNYRAPYFYGYKVLEGIKNKFGYNEVTIPKNTGVKKARKRKNKIILKFTLLYIK